MPCPSRRLSVLLLSTLACVLYAGHFSLSSAASEETTVAKPGGSGIRYSVEITAPGGDETLVSEMKTNSQLLWLQDEPPDTRLALERRVIADEETAGKILRSQGYYEGKVSRDIDWDATPARIRIELSPGPRSTIGRTEIVYRSTGPDSGPFTDEKLFPRDLAAFGLKKGEAADASSVLGAVQRITAHLERNGYPFSRIIDTRYVAIESTHALTATVVVAPGPLLRMGPVRIEGAAGIEESYLNRLVPWRIGEPWDVDSINAYRTALQETGLFSVITLKPADNADLGPREARSADEADGKGVLTPVLLSVTEAPPRTISGGVRYSTDNGFGVSGSWENRNLLGGGERLRVTMPITQDLQMLSANFRKPAFGHRDQSLVGEAEARNETTDAYDQTAGYLAGGIERRFSGSWRHWWGSARISVEGGELNDHLKGRRNYALFGIPLGLRRDTTDDLFNPTQGTRLALTVTPYTGVYDGALSTVRSRLDASAYMKATDSDRLVLATRAAIGSLTGENVENIPPSLRFYVGGGGSVRGYKYQSIGPQNEDGDPLGGLSFADVSFEARFRVGDNFGIVPFIDGGMVYEDALPKFGQDMYWGAGLGFRYYTSIGPVRLDVAVPLQDRDNQKAFQIYLSLGQAF